MDANIIAGYSGAFLTGLVLGLLGGGGALLSIPVLVYLFNLEPSVATGYSLFLIGVAASSGAFQNIRKKNVEYQAALWYGIPSVITVYSVRRFLIPNLPEELFHIGGFVVTKNHLILLVLSVVMLATAFKMITSKDNTEAEAVEAETHYFRLVLYAIVIGAFLGLVGAGGGFLMVPALVFFARLPMKKALGTSLVLVAVNSFIGFMGDIHSDQSLDWAFLLKFSAFCITGVIIGIRLQNKVDGTKMKKYFGWFMLLMAIYIITREVFFS